MRLFRRADSTSDTWVGILDWASLEKQTMRFLFYYSSDLVILCLDSLTKNKHYGQNVKTIQKTILKSLMIKEFKVLISSLLVFN